MLKKLFLTILLITIKEKFSSTIFYPENEVKQNTEKFMLNKYNITLLFFFLKINDSVFQYIQL